MTDIIYKTVKPSHKKKIQIIQNLKNLMFQNSKECRLGESVISLCLGSDDKNLGASFEWRGARVKMPRINVFSRDANSINLKTFPTHSGI